MAEGVLGLGGGGAAGLNQELIDKLKAAERKAKVEPIEKRIEDITTEKEKFAEIESKVFELLETVRPFDLFVTEGSNVFEQKSATTSGESVTFEATDASKLEKGFISVNVDTLAQKDVYQSSSFTALQKNSLGDIGTLDIKVGDNTVSFDTASFSTYDDLATEINKTEGIKASVEQVGTDSYKLILKSETSGTENALTISGSASHSLGYPKDVYESNTINTDASKTLGDIGILTINDGTNSYDFDTSTYSTYDDLTSAIKSTTGLNANLAEVATNSYKLEIMSDDIPKKDLTISGTANSTLGYTSTTVEKNDTNHVLKAQDMKAFVDGVEYNVAENEITLDGLKMSANKVGESSINISEDNLMIEASLQNMITKYNEFVEMIDEEVLNPETTIQDKSALREMLSQVKDKLFGSYGEKSDLSFFAYGVDLDKSGKLSLDSEKFNEAIDENRENLQNLFIGTADNKGMGTQLKELLDEMSFSGGALSSYNEGMTSREETLNEDKEKAEELLNAKYQQLANQFAAYGSIINSFESAFGGLKMMIEQSVSSN